MKLLILSLLVGLLSPAVFAHTDMSNDIHQHDAEEKQVLILDN